MKKHAFFCGKFDTFQLDRYSSLIVKNIEDLNVIKAIIINRKLKINDKVSYDKLIKLKK